MMTPELVPSWKTVLLCIMPSSPRIIWLRRESPEMRTRRPLTVRSRCIWPGRSAAGATRPSDVFTTVAITRPCTTRSNVSKRCESSPDLDALLCDLRRAISACVRSESSLWRQSPDWQRNSRKVMTLAKNEAMLEALAERVASKLRADLMQVLSLVQKPVDEGPVNMSTRRLPWKPRTCLKRQRPRPGRALR